jgi:hypothetical protein
LDTWYPKNEVGPTTFPQADLSDIHDGENGTENWHLEQLCWFDYWLKGIENGVMEEDPVKLYVWMEKIADIGVQKRSGH